MADYSTDNYTARATASISKSPRIPKLLNPHTSQYVKNHVVAHSHAAAPILAPAIFNARGKVADAPAR